MICIGLSLRSQMKHWETKTEELTLTVLTRLHTSVQSLYIPHPHLQQTTLVLLKTAPVTGGQSIKANAGDHGALALKASALCPVTLLHMQTLARYRNSIYFMSEKDLKLSPQKSY